MGFQCEVCELAKHHHASFPKSKYKSPIPFTLIHNDLWGPSRTPNRTHKKWFITFIDDHTRPCWVYLLTDKTKIRSVFMNFHSMIQNQFHTKIQILRTDNGTEYFNHSLSTYLQKMALSIKVLALTSLSKIPTISLCFSRPIIGEDDWQC